MSEAFKIMSGEEYIRENGVFYNNAFAVSYGHKECIERDYAYELANTEVDRASGSGRTQS